MNRALNPDALNGTAYKPSQDMLIRKRNEGRFNDNNRGPEKPWVSCSKPVPEYHNKMRPDDKNFKRGRKFLNDKGDGRNPITQDGVITKREGMINVSIFN